MINKEERQEQEPAEELAEEGHLKIVINHMIIINMDHKLLALTVMPNLL